MDKGIYTALSGGVAKAHELELVANNLANANTPGFKRDTGTFNEYLMELRRPDTVEGLAREIKALTDSDGRPPGDKSFVEMDGIYTDYSQGLLQQTGRAFDIGLEGDGFFEVLTPTGLRYTRQGNFSLSPQGVLVTANGFPVLSRQTNLPPEQRQIRLGGGPVEITPEGLIIQRGARVGEISVVEFYESQWLEKVGNSYYRNVHPDNQKPRGSKTKLHQSFLEGSNVNAVGEMTKLIEVTRAYESHMQAIKTYQEIDSKTANEIVKER
ncbi:MAG: flagellar basal-body rod protein FlgF [Deltaproteobacteria bacterium]|nr:flagellar basal-body rod protein FlgF [Deltaproteobacteria bacterium]